MHDTIKATDEEKHKVNLGFYKLRLVGIAECAFVDKLIIYAAKEEKLEDNMKLL